MTPAKESFDPQGVLIHRLRTSVLEYSLTQDTQTLDTSGEPVPIGSLSQHTPDDYVNLASQSPELRVKEAVEGILLLFYFMLGYQAASIRLWLPFPLTTAFSSDPCPVCSLSQATHTHLFLLSTPQSSLALRPIHF